MFPLAGQTLDAYSRGSFYSLFKSQGPLCSNGAVQTLSILACGSLFSSTARPFHVPLRSIAFTLIRSGPMLEEFPLVCATATSESMAAQFGHTKSIFLREKPTRNYLRCSYPYKLVVRRKHSVQYLLRQKP
ncbi:hypothetical protein Ddc_06603 [Ditylenchus destructor]|nr:hypothetical protein Ddc_06603 [Ditylenchus destructor]